MWLGPFLGVDATGRTITVQTPDGTKIQTFNAVQIRPYCQAVNFSLKYFEAETNKTPLFQTYLTRVILPRAPRTWKFTEAKREELEGLINSDT